MKIHIVTFILLIIGGLNWGLEVLGYGIGNYVSATVATVVYVLVAVSALYEIFMHKSFCRNCSSQRSM